MRKFFARAKKSQSLQEKFKKLIKLEIEQLEHRAAPTETISSVLALAYTMHNGPTGLGGAASQSTSITQPQTLAVTGKPHMPLPRGLPTKPAAAGSADPAPAAQLQIAPRPVGGLEQDQVRFGVLNDQPFNLFDDSPPPPPRTGGLDNLADHPAHGGSDGNGASGASPGSHSSTGGLEQGSYDNFSNPPHGSGRGSP